MKNRTKFLLGGLVAVLISVSAIWWFVFRDTAPEAASLTGAIAAGPTTDEEPSPPSGESLDGVWTVDTSQDSFAGFRVREELAGIGAKTTVGRTRAVTGTVEFRGTTVTSAAIEADLTQLQSDSETRDRALRRQAIETDTFPTATFVTSRPIELDGVPAEGIPFSVEAVGDLTIHGVTREVTVPIEGQLVGRSMVLVGSIDIVFADYAIDTPSAAVVLSVEDNGEMEFQLFLTKSTGS